MGDWADITVKAQRAHSIMLRDRVSGEQEFRSLLEEHPNDGMVFFKRGKAYQALAANDYKHAEKFFPLAEYKDMAREAYSKVRPQEWHFKAW